MRSASPCFRRRAPGVAAAVLLATFGGGCAPDVPTPITLSSAGGSRPTTAPLPEGAVVAWVGTQDGASDVWLARLDAGGSTSAPVRVNDVAGDAAPHAQAPAQVATSDGGDVYVLWQNNTPQPGRRFPTSDLRFARSTDGGRTFGPAITVNDDAGGPPASHTFHDLVVGADGSLWASWIDGRNTTEEAQAPGQAYSGPDIRVALSTDGGVSFGPSTIVDEDACPCCRTALAVAADGAVFVAWRKVLEGSVRDVVVARSLDGGRTFEAPVRVHADDWVFDGCPHAGPALAVDRSGTVHVAWFTGKEGEAGLYYARSTDGGRSFGARVPLRVGDDALVAQAALTASGDHTWLAWEERVPGRSATRLLAIPADAAPDAARARIIEDASLPALAPFEGGVWVAWLDDETVRAGPIHDPSQ